MEWRQEGSEDFLVVPGDVNPGLLLWLMDPEILLSLSHYLFSKPTFTFSWGSKGGKVQLEEKSPPLFLIG